MDTRTFVDLYEILEVAKTATDEQIKDAIKQQRRTWYKRQNHPDQQKRHEAETRIGQIAEAERTLLDAPAKQRYDQQLANYRPPSAPAASSAASSDWLERAREFLVRGDANSASYAAREATSQQGNNADAWAVRARASLMAGRPSDAVFEFQEALRISPNEPEFHFDLGSVYESDGQWAMALRSYEAAAGLAPQASMYRVAIASVYIQSDRARQAVPILEEVMAGEPENEVVPFYLAVALHDVSVDHMVRVTGDAGGGYHIISAEGAYRVQELTRRALRLQFDDAELRSALTSKLMYAENQLKSQFHVPWLGAGEIASSCGGAVFILFLIGTVVLAFPLFFAGVPILAILIAGPWYWLMYKWHWQPGWKVTEKASRGHRVSR